MSTLAQRHEVSAAALANPTFDRAVSEQAMRKYCREVVLLPARAETIGKRLLQVRSLFSRKSFETHFLLLPAFQGALDSLLTKEAFDIVVLCAGVFMNRYRLRQAPPGMPLPRLVLDEQNIEFDLQRQMSHRGSVVRRLHHSFNWRKVRREEKEQWQSHDGVTFTSFPDQERARALVPTLRSAVVPNAVDVSAFEPQPGDPPADGVTVLFFGINDYYPNTDAILFFVREIWPLVLARHPRARLKIVGPRPTPEILGHASNRIEVTGRVDDMRPHIASAAVVIVPLRLGGGTRLKVLEAMAMAKPMVSTTIGAEGIDVVHEKHLLLADEPSRFAEAVGRVLDDPDLGTRLGREGRALVRHHYSWEGAANRMEAFFEEVLATPP
jgi:polysaccharide biosynthesis protein PslH